MSWQPAPDAAAGKGTETPVRASSLGIAAGQERQEAVRIVRGELGAPHPVPLPEFPQGPPGTTPLTRSVSHLSGLSVALGPHGWRLTGSRAGDDAAARAARSAHASLVSMSADVLGDEPAGDTVVRVAGPATLAASLALPGGEPVLQDAGAVRDVSQAWAEGMRELASALSTSLPRASAVLHVHEPRLNDVVNGRVRSSSGYRLLPAWDQAEVAAAWARLAADTRCWLPLAAGPSSPPVATADALLFDEPGEDPGAWEPIAMRVEGGGDVVLRLRREGARTVAERALRVARPWRRLGLEASALGRLVLLAGPDEALGPGGLRRSAIAARDLADALDVVRRDDLDALR